jgi:hypothetical protein
MEVLEAFYQAHLLPVEKQHNGHLQQAHHVLTYVVIHGEILDINCCSTIVKSFSSGGTTPGSMLFSLENILHSNENEDFVLLPASKDILQSNDPKSNNQALTMLKYLLNPSTQLMKTMILSK